MFRYSVRDYKSLPELAESINSGVLSIQPEVAAARYAVDTVFSYNGYTAPIDLEDELTAHLDILREAGANFDGEAALEAAIKLYTDELKQILNSSTYTLERVKSNVVFSNNDVNVIIATFETPFGDVEFTISYWLYDDGCPVIREAFLFHDGTDGERFAAVHPADRVWLEVAAALAIDLADVTKILIKGGKND